MIDRLYILGVIAALSATCLTCPCDAWAQQIGRYSQSGPSINPTGDGEVINNIDPEPFNGAVVVDRGTMGPMPPDPKRIAAEQVVRKGRETARKLFLQHEYTKALAAYQNTLDQYRYPELNCYAGMGEVLAAMGRTKEAIADYQRAIYPVEGQHYVFPGRGEPQVTEIQLQYALLLSKTGRGAEAYDLYAFTTRPKIHDMLPDREQNEAGRWLELPFTAPNVPRTFDRRSFEPMIYTALGLLASVRRDGGNADDDEAIAFLRQALKLSRNFAPAYFQLGKALMHWDKKEEARAAWKKAVSLDREGIGIASAATRQLREAESKK